MRYEIRNVNDLLQVPPDRREVCLKELLRGLELAEAEKKKLPWWLRWAARLSRFVWIDDGKTNATVSVDGKVVYQSKGN